MLPIGAEEDFGSLSAKLAALGGEMLVRASTSRSGVELELREQDGEGVTYAEKIEPGERRLDPSRPAAELARVVRALTPHVGAYLEAGEEERLGVRRAHAVGGELGAGELRADGGALLLGCGEGPLRLDVVQPAGGRPMDAADYLRGHSLPSR